MKKRIKIRLTDYYPELAKEIRLPVNIEFAQFYTMEIEKKGSPKVNVDNESTLTIKVAKYQTDSFTVYSTLGKPISKILKDE
jgi:hypothetical protein